MTETHELLVDDDGVPVLTDVVPPEVEPGELPDNRLVAMSVEDVIQTILTSQSLYKVYSAITSRSALRNCIIHSSKSICRVELNN